jgi:protein phosphatase
MSHTDNAMRGMGTTLCAVALVMIETHERLAVVNVGDSRVYVLQDGALIQVSEDHSLVESMVRQGTLTPEQAKVHPQRNILTRALGIDGEVGVDSWEVAPFSGDRYLLCSDGLFNEVPDERIAEVLATTEDPNEAASILVTMANEGGGRDNITVVIVDVVEGLDPSEALPMEENVGLEGFDPNTTAAITPVGDWLDDTSPEPEHELPPPLPPPFHTDAGLDDLDDDDDGDGGRKRQRARRGGAAPAHPHVAHRPLHALAADGRRHRRRRRGLVRARHLLRRLRPQHRDALQGPARRCAVVPADDRQALRPATGRDP